MKTKTFLGHLEEQEIIRAIASAEKKTSGEIRVLVSHKKIKDSIAFAQKQFLKTKMDQTQKRNAVLIVIAPRSQNFAVVGDVGIHEKVGDTFWEKISEIMSHHFKENDFHQGLIAGITKVGDSLAEYFPRKRSDQDELPNQPF